MKIILTTGVMIEARTLHRALWKWLSKRENALENKVEWPGWKHNGGRVERVTSCCFACHVANYLAANRVTFGCEMCPLPHRACRESGSLFQQWSRERRRGRYSKKLSELAAEIRDSEWVEK